VSFLEAESERLKAKSEGLRAQSLELFEKKR